MPRTEPITVGWREVERRAAHWRMRPPSEEGRDNRTRLERGPQGSGGASGSASPGPEPGKRCHGSRYLEATVKPGAAHT